MKVALVHEWLTTFAGSEKVTEQILKLYPQADLFAVVDFLDDNDRQYLQGKQATTTFIQRLPGAKKHYQKYLPLMPVAIEQLDVTKYDLVISSSHAVAKGVITGPDQLHICYCHSPIRYGWDLHHQYLTESGLTRGPKSWFARWMLHKFRMWDVRTANGVDVFVSNSDYIGRRIRKAYGRDSITIYPGVDVEHFQLETEKDDYYFVASRLVPYKKIHEIVKAFAQMPDKTLIVAGKGPDFERIRAIATPNVTLKGFVSDDEMNTLMQKAKAFVYAAEEDFGIVPIEAMACGTPVIGFSRGGLGETVIPGKTGVHFTEQTAESIKNAVTAFESETFDAQAIRAFAEGFSNDRFRREFKTLVDKQLGLGHQDWRIG